MDIRSGRIGGLVLALALSAAPARAAILGGSNYAWFGLDAAHYSNDAVAAREPYAVIQNYDTAKTQIDAQLQTMRSNGQTAISIPIFYADGLYNNQVLNASSGDLTAHDKANLTNLIAMIKQDGFKQVEYRFDGQYSIAPASWKTWQAAEFQRTWSLIQSLHPLFAAGGVPYLVDLQNEGTPVSNYAPQAQLLAFDKLLWTDYTGTFGTADTVGFSTIADPARIASLGAVYGSTLPGVFDFHLYGPPLEPGGHGRALRGHVQRAACPRPRSPVDHRRDVLRRPLDRRPDRRRDGHDGAASERDLPVAGGPAEPHRPLRQPGRGRRTPAGVRRLPAPHRSQLHENPGAGQLRAGRRRPGEPRSTPDRPAPRGPAGAAAGQAASSSFALAMMRDTIP